MTAARLLIAIAAAAGIAACADIGGTLDETSPGVERAGAPPPQAAQALVQPGKTKSQVAAALGGANGVAFESGYEVWVYRWLAGDRSARAATELVILFGPDGTVRKSRIRMGAAG